MTAASVKSVIITQAIAIAVFVVVPVAITLMVPLTDLTVRRTGPTASITVTRYVLMFLPWRIQTIDNVRVIRAEISDEKYYGDTLENRRKGRVGTTSVATGQLVIEGNGPTVIVQAAPELATQTQDGFAGFLAATDPAPVRVPLYASWWLSYVLGGVATAFAAFYIVGSALAIVTWPFKRRKAASLAR
jgi:hypothetical protein